MPTFLLHENYQPCSEKDVFRSIPFLICLKVKVSMKKAYLVISHLVIHSKLINMEFDEKYASQNRISSFDTESRKSHGPLRP